VKLKLKIDLFLLFFQNSTVYDLSNYFCPSLYNKNEMMFLGKRITSERLNRFGQFFFLNVRDSPNRVFIEKKMWKSCPENWKIREKLKVLFSMRFL
jgi:hypothetical protein